MPDWLKADNLSVHYDGKMVLNGLSFTFSRRGIVLCTGPSGSGKSTLALLLTGHLVPREGSIFVNGKAISCPSRAAIMVSQDDDLFPWLKMRDQLNFFRGFPRTHFDWEPLARRLRIDDAESLYTSEMSGGMRKRLGLLRATILRPQLLVLDETLASVEPELRESILRDFREIWRELEIGVVLITHDNPPGISAITEGEIRITKL